MKYLTNYRDAFVFFAGVVPAALMGFLALVFNWVMSFERQEIAVLGLFGSAFLVVSFSRCASRKAEGADLLGILFGTILMIVLVTLLLVPTSIDFWQAVLIGFLALLPTSVGVLLFWECFYSSERQTEYTFTVLRQLQPDELSKLQADCQPHLASLIRRYFSEYDLGPDFPSSVGDLDLVRGSWLIDKRAGRPDYTAVVHGVGFEFGRLLERKYGFSWSLVEDSHGEVLSMVRSGKEHEPISIPPFSYVEKRELTQNVEVFQDFLKQVSPETLGDKSGA